MKTTITLLFLLSLLTLGMVHAQTADANDLWMAAITPGEQHAFLKRMEGEWKCVQTSYMEEGKTDVMEGSASKSMILGDRYLEESMKGTALGMPFAGKNTFGYDNLLKKYRTFWIDNMGTGFMIGEGQRKGNVITIVATYPDVMGGADQRYKMIYTVQSDQKHSMEMFMVMENGDEAKQMDIVYTKIK